MKRWLRILLQLLGLLLFVGVVWWAGLDSLRVLLDSRWQPLLWGLLLTGSAQALSAWRLQLLTRSVAGVAAPWRNFYVIVMTAQLLGLVLPRSVSAVGGKTAGLKALGVPLTRGVWIVMLDNLCDVALLLLLVLPGVAAAAGWIGYGLMYASYVVVTVAAIGLASWLADNRFWLEWLTPVTQLPLVGLPFEKQLLPLLRSIPAGRTIRQLILLTALLSTALALRFYFIGAAIQLDASASLFLAVFPATQLSLVVALAPGGLGVFEWGWVGLLTLANVPDPGQYAVAQRAFTTLYNLFWGVVGYLVSWRIGRTGDLKSPV